MASEKIIEVSFPAPPDPAMESFLESVRVKQENPWFPTPIEIEAFNAADADPTIVLMPELRDKRDKLKEWEAKSQDQTSEARILSFTPRLQQLTDGIINDEKKYGQA